MIWSADYSLRRAQQEERHAQTVGIQKLCQSIFIGAALSMMQAGCQAEPDAPTIGLDKSKRK